MRGRFVTFIGLFGGLLGLSACGGAPDTTSSTGTPAASTQASPGPAAPSVSVSAVVHALDGSVVAGVRACVLEQGKPGDCVATGADGSLALKVPANSLVAVTLEKTGFVPMVRAFETFADDVTLPESENVLLPAGVLDMKPTGGLVAFTVDGANASASPSVSVSMTEASGTVQTPIYLDAFGLPIPGATTGTQGRFVDVEPGLQALVFSDPSAKCSGLSLYGWPVTAFQDPTSGVALIAVPVLKGFVTAPVAASCVKAQ
jgi:hypothetical protein